MCASHCLPQAQHRQPYNEHYAQGLCQIAAAYPPHHTHYGILPRHPFKGAGCCILHGPMPAVYASFFTPFTAGLHCIPPPFVPFRSSISISLGNPRKRGSFATFHNPFLIPFHRRSKYPFSSVWLIVKLAKPHA